MSAPETKHENALERIEETTATLVLEKGKGVPAFGKLPDPLPVAQEVRKRKREHSEDPVEVSQAAEDTVIVKPKQITPIMTATGSYDDPAGSKPPQAFREVKGLVSSPSSSLNSCLNPLVRPLQGLQENSFESWLRLGRQRSAMCEMREGKARVLLGWS
jgi:hypothetical protein